MYTYIHTHTHCPHTHIQILIMSLFNGKIAEDLQDIHMHTNIQTYTHTYIHTYIRTYPLLLTAYYGLFRLSSFPMYMCIHYTYIHTYTYTHTYIHTS